MFEWIYLTKRIIFLHARNTTRALNYSLYMQYQNIVKFLVQNKRQAIIYAYDKICM